MQNKPHDNTLSSAILLSFNNKKLNVTQKREGEWRGKEGSVRDCINDAGEYLLSQEEDVMKVLSFF